MNLVRVEGDLRVLGRNEAVRIMLRDDMENCDVSEPCEWYRNAERLEAPDPLVTKAESKLAGFVITLSLMAFCFLLIYGATEGYKHVNQVTDSIVEALWPSK